MALVVENVIGTIDGVNKDFETPTEYVAGTLKHIYNGVVIDPAWANGLVENGGTSFTLKEAPQVNDNLLAIYDDGLLTEPRLDIRVKTRTMVLLFDCDYASRELVLVQGDNLPPLYFTITDEDGQPVSLVGAVAKFKFRVRGDTVQANSGSDTAVIDSPLLGTVIYNWTSSDLSTVGEYEGELEVTWPGPLVNTTSNTIYFVVRQQIG